MSARTIKGVPIHRAIPAPGVVPLEEVKSKGRAFFVAGGAIAGVIRGHDWRSDLLRSIASA